MAWSNIQVQVTYEQIDKSHVLFHFFGPKRTDHWMLLDLEEHARMSGKSIEQLIANLKKSIGGKDEPTRS